ncbi:hypothetical protein MMC17_006986 [Xylographa soralifera]|nr:hypothetical protein [Xylographa soralifera]
MVVLKHVEVKIISVPIGQRLKEYDVPDSEIVADDEETGSGKIQKYIEAESGKEFEIQVILKKGFSYHGAAGIHIKIGIDGDALNRNHWRPRPPHVLPSTKLRADVVEVVSGTKIKRGEEWRYSRFGFGEVTVDEDLHLDATALQEKLRKLGSIHIAVCRATRTTRVKPTAYKSAKVTTSSELDKKLIVKSISHTFKLGTEKVIEEPKPHKHAWAPLLGPYSTNLQYVFFYRSYRALQYLGCIPTTPEPVPLSERHPADMTDEEKASQIVELRAGMKVLHDEIQQLKLANQALVQEMGDTRDLNMKINALQAALGSLGTMPTPGPNRSTIKKERIKQELAEESGTPSRPAKRVKPEYVTLDE